MSEDSPSRPHPDLAELARLLETMAVLRGPDGCPWDREQTLRSLRPHVIEEAHELADALGSGDLGAIEEECGDLLLQVVFLARIATEEGQFGMADIARGIADKLIRRHPHVFTEGPRAEGSEEALASWEEAKSREKAGRRDPLDGIPVSLPGLLLASKAMKRLREPGSVGDAVRTLEAAIASPDRDTDRQARERAVGDLLLRVVAAARRAGVDPETALRDRVLGELGG